MFIMIDKINSVSGKDDFVKFLYELSEDYLLHQEEWENTSVSDYIEQIASWIEDFSKCPRNDINWENMDYSVIARIFYMGKIYE